MNLPLPMRRFFFQLFAQLPGTSYIIRKIKQLEAQANLLAMENTELHKALKKQFEDHRRQVDLLDFGPISVFMYTHDLAYQQTPLHERNFSTAAHVEKMARRGPMPPPALDPLTRHTLLFGVFRHYWQHNLPFTLLDVGCQYGSFALYAAQVIRSFGHNNHVAAFDIGIAGELVPYSIELNGLGDMVTFEPLAVAGHSLPTIVFTEFGRSENNRVVNRSRPTEYESYIVRATTLDDYTRSRQIGTHLIVKIDAQGAEYDIWLGMQDCLRTRYVTFLTEFAPHALSGRVDAGSFLRLLGQNAALIDVPGEADLPLRRILPDGFDAFVGEVDARPGRQTDLLVVPSHLPGVDELLSQIV